jgi:hypothetical protein
MKYAIPPTIPLPLPFNVGEVNYELVRAQLPENWLPDIVLTIDAGIHCCQSIKIAEASKVIENTQRDLNIALI